MFEGLVRQLILGYLGQYIKDIQKEQLRITLWNEEVLLENVELILEAFDYLQLPFSLKEGRVGRLSIKIPWKKLGWDPIIIILEDVLICACQRDDQEWSLDAVEKRELAGKKAKLAAAELAKLSRRVCDNRAGESFTSYITAKILDGIQLSIKDVHVLYRHALTDSTQTIFGLKFSRLTVMNQNVSRFGSGMARASQVNKLVEVEGLEIYCSSCQNAPDLESTDDSGHTKFWGVGRLEGNKRFYLLAPLDLSMTLLVNRSGKIENDAPQYIINIRSDGLVFALDEVQLQEILNVWDYLSTYHLKEKYGRYRPLWSSLSEKHTGWQIAWWQYAQHAILSDVHKRLRRTSWKYLGERLSCRRKYVNLYKKKLECLHREQLVDEDIVLELEQIEKESDIDDILNYRSSAERELQEFLVKTSSNLGSNVTNNVVDKVLDDEHSANKPRGWLNWLSRGVLGAGGTDVSSQFSGVVSDEVVKDIYEATKFQPVSSVDNEAETSDKIYLSSVNININQISVQLRSSRCNDGIAELILRDIFMDCKIWEESAIITASVNYTEMLNPFNKQIILLTRRAKIEESLLQMKPSINIQVDVSSVDHDVELSMKITLQPLEMTCDPEFVLSIMEFYNVLRSTKFHHESVLLSLNGIEDVKARLASKADYILSSRKKVAWEANFQGVTISIPWETTHSGPHKMVLEAPSLSFIRKCEVSSLLPEIGHSSGGKFMEFQHGELYDNFDATFIDTKIKILMPYDRRPLSVVENFNAAIAMRCCIIPDELMLESLEVFINISSLDVHFSPSICGALLELIGKCSELHLTSELSRISRPNSLTAKAMNSGTFSFSIIANLESACFLMDLENDAENSCTIILFVEELDVRFSLTEFPEFWIATNTLKITCMSSQIEDDSLVLCLSKNDSASLSASHHDMGGGHGNLTENADHKSTSVHRCFWLHYEVRKMMGTFCHRYEVCITNIILHCYPHIIALLVGVFDRIYGFGISPVVSDGSAVECRNPSSDVDFDFQSFGFSNFSETGSSECASIPLDHFPFVTIRNSGLLLGLENSLIYTISNWRKVLQMRDRKIQSQDFSINKGCNVTRAPKVESTFSTVAEQRFNDIKLFLIDLNLSHARLHFHDSSGIVGTVTLPTSSSSFSIHEDHMDMLCSTDGLVFSSLWHTSTIHDFLWGPLLPHLSPILNLRVRKSLHSPLELCFNVQHVSCILPPEFLSIIIGYFSLPDWRSGRQEPPVDEIGHFDSEDNSVIIYKFEILDSVLFTPVESEGSLFLKLDIQQLYCSFFPNKDSNVILQDIPSECLVSAYKVADRNHCLTLFGRDLSVSMVFPKDDAAKHLNINHGSACREISLFSLLSTDVWVVIPNECVRSFASTCIMARIRNCQLIDEGGYLLVGYTAFLNIIDQFSIAHKQADNFTSDVLHFLQSKKCINKNSAFLSESAGVSFTEVRCCVNSLSVKFHSYRGEQISSPLVAKAEMGFVCSVSLRNDTPICFDFSFCSLVIFSFLSSVVLVEHTSPCLLTSVLDGNFSVTNIGEIDLRISFPSLNVWLHLFDWNEIVKIFQCYSEQLPKTSTLNRSSINSSFGLVDQLENASFDVLEDFQYPPASSSFSSDTLKYDAVSFVLNFDNILVTIYYPLLEVPKESQVPQEKHPSDISYVVDRNHRCFIVITLECRQGELISDGKSLNLKSNFEKVTGKIELCEDVCVHKWPFFQLFQVSVMAESCNSHMDNVHVKAEVECDNLHVWLSDHILYLWQFFRFVIPEAGSSEAVFSSMRFTLLLRKVSLLLTDGKLSSSGPLLETVLRNLLLLVDVSENLMEGSVAGGLEVYYNNIYKVSWEPFIEPSNFEMSITRRHKNNALLCFVVLTDIQLKSTAPLNLNLTESFIEVAFRATEMIKDAWGPRNVKVLSHESSFYNSRIGETVYMRRYVPYILQNLTSLPLVFRVGERPVKADDLDLLTFSDGELLQPGLSVPVYIDEALEEQILCSRPANSSDSLSDKQFMGVGHHYILVQLEGTSTFSPPISMDLVGLSYFEMDFSNPSNGLEVETFDDSFRSNVTIEGSNRRYRNSGFVIPVVVDVSIQQYTKLVRLHSTVVLVNATSVPFEVRFDIPFGVSPKILDPIYPGGEFPLPLHLAETGRMRWRPLGNTYLWSEAYNILNIVSHESRIGFLRSFVCYPSHPSSDPFRCCTSVQSMSLSSVSMLEKGSSLYTRDIISQSVEKCSQRSSDNNKTENRLIHIVTLSSPLIVKSYLPLTLSLSIDSNGVTRTALLSEQETSFFHVDSLHDLAVTFYIHGFRPSILKLPRAETFGPMAKFNGLKFSLSETITFDSDSSKGSLFVTMEKVMDAFSGAREICIYVPFLLYNCTGLSIIVKDLNGTKGHACVVPSYYDFDEHDPVLGKDGLGLLTSDEDLDKASSVRLRNSFLKNPIVLTRKNVNSKAFNFLGESLKLSSMPTLFNEHSDKLDLDAQELSVERLQGCSSSISQSTEKSLDSSKKDHKTAAACMYSLDPNFPAGEIMVKVSRCVSDCDVGNIPNGFWSNPFLLVPPTGSTTVLVPHPFSKAAYITSVTSNPVGEPFSGKTRIITFQPRYVISNACCKGLCYRQKGTDVVSHLGVGQHSHVHWTDTSRELLVSIRFDEPGWQWSGCFLPEHLGDTQVKMRCYVSGAVQMIRVEVQNADVSVKDEIIAGSPPGNSGTILILLSDDDTGFMPYRIDNFSMERLRVYQQRCETFETIINSYTSFCYAWDEPFYPHRLTVEVPGEHTIGTYTLDDVKEHSPVTLPATSEKPQSTWLISVHAEGATKVLSIIDSSYHILNDIESEYIPQMKEMREHDRKLDNFIHYEERISVSIPSIGISVMSSYPQELLFASVNNTIIELAQSLDRQKFSLQISTLQIDNQLQDTPYPVILYFDHENRRSPVGSKDEEIKIGSDNVVQSPKNRPIKHVLSLAAAKWRNSDIPLVSFEYITLRVADFHLQLEEEMILSLFELYKVITKRLQSRIFPHADSTLPPLFSDFGIMKETSTRSNSYDPYKANRFHVHSSYDFKDHKGNPLKPSVVPVGAPGQKIYLLARKQNKIYVELFDVAPMKLTFSFSSSPWILRNGVLTLGESLIHRGLVALADVEGAQIHFKRLIITHQLSSWESLEEILVRHYTRQLLHEIYKVFGSAGVIGNPVGFARRMGLGIKEFLSVPARSVLQSPAGLITGMAEGTSSLVNNTVYAISDAATQFSRAAHKGIVAFTFDDQAVAMEKQQKGISSHSKGVINELLEGLTGLLQSPIKGAEKHGLPGVLSGIALGVTGLVARPAASILEVTGKTAQSIRNRSKLHHSGSWCLRVRLPRPLSRGFPLVPYSWEEAVGMSVLGGEADEGLKLKDEILVMCKALKEGGKFAVMTERLVLVVSCSSLVDLGKPEFKGIPSDPQWVVEEVIRMVSIIDAEAEEEVVHIVAGTADAFHKICGGGMRGNKPPPLLPIYQTSLEFKCKQVADELLHVLLSAIEKGKQTGWGSPHLIHRGKLKL